jgi:hypothetical protein
VAFGTYERIEFAGRTFVNVALTPDAERHGMSIALPENVCS